MKNRVLSFFKKYWFCFLLSVIMAMGISLSTRYANLYESGSDDSMIRFDLRDFYLVFGLPIFSLIYGCLSYIKSKRIWVPQLILFLIAFLYWFRFDINALAWAGTFIWSSYPAIFSLIGTLITALVYYIIRTSKENHN